MSETPKFIQEMSEEYQRNNDQQKELSRKIDEAWEKWNEARAAIAKFPGWELTGDRREPHKGDDYLSEDRIPEPLHCHADPNRNYPEIRFILRKVEPKPEPPKVDREEAIRKAKEEAKIARGYFREIAYTGKKLGALIEAVEAIPDKPDEPRVVWACPQEITERLQIIANILADQDLPNTRRKVEVVLDRCFSTREATVEEGTEALRNYFSIESKVTNSVRVESIFHILNRAGYRVMKEG